MKIIKSMVLFFMFCAVFLASALLFPTQSSAGVALPEISAQDVKQIADEGKDPFIGAIFMEYYKDFGKEVPGHPVSTLQEAMDSNSSVHQDMVKNPVIKVGEPFEVYTISPDDIQNYNPSVDISSILVSTNQWLVPVTFYGKQRGLLIVGYLEDSWQVVGMSVSDTSEMVENNARMGVLGENPPSKFVRVYPNKIDFVVTNTKGNGESKILAPSYIASVLGLDAAKADASGLYDADDFMLRLAAVTH